MPIISSFGAGSVRGFGRGKGKKPFFVQYLVIGGGGAGGAQQGGAGGAGGYRLNVPGETSGRNSTAEAELELYVGEAYQVTVGAGGTSSGGGPMPRPARPRGEDTVFASITSIGGGTGNPVTSPDQINGGASSGNPSGTGTPGQGFDGGPPNSVPFAYGTTGAGAAGGTGAATPNGGGSTGGAGLFSSITGSPIQRAGGGGGGNRPGQHGGGPFVPGGPGGPGGGGAGSNTHQSAGTPGSVNTGGGGGDEGYNNQPPGSPHSVVSGSGAGGSGLVVIKVPSDITASFTPGVTQNPSSTPTHNIYTVTAAGVSDEVTFIG